MSRASPVQDRPPRKDRPAPADASPPTQEPPRRVSKKDQITALYLAGITELEDIALMTKSRPSYVAAVLQEAKLLKGYFDLYTPSGQPMNVYSKFFAGKLGYKDEDTARASVAVIDRYYHLFRLARDRAGQHHALVVALTLYDRARFSNKPREAEVFRRWLVDLLNAPEETGAPAEAAE